jgi:hypothetical protein
MHQSGLASEQQAAGLERRHSRNLFCLSRGSLVSQPTHGWRPNAPCSTRRPVRYWHWYWLVLQQVWRERCAKRPASLLARRYRRLSCRRRLNWSLNRRWWWVPVLTFESEPTPSLSKLRVKTGSCSNLEAGLTETEGSNLMAGLAMTESEPSLRIFREVGSPPKVSLDATMPVVAAYGNFLHRLPLLLRCLSRYEPLALSA